MENKYEERCYYYLLGKCSLNILIQYYLFFKVVKIDRFKISVYKNVYRLYRFLYLGQDDIKVNFFRKQFGSFLG